jgi:hypothetical protein
MVSDELEGKRSDEQAKTWCVFENKLVINWFNLNLSLVGPSCPLYIGDQVSRIQSGLIQIQMSVYDIISYFDYIYA